ncbi:MAG: GTP 3',8-cyclase MoaA [Oscillospiraceae bacterium]|nr:GTP 3',8-cyclase MoaA [Oscillospiraceae bacterium]
MKDRFGREIEYLRLSVTERCNLRCRYCMPEEGICKKRHEDMLTEDEMILAVQAAASLGIRKVRITGGEPLVKKNILSICQRIADISGIEELCLTTNGLLLPQYAAALKAAGVKRINLSLDTLRPERYAHITRCGELHQALDGLAAALSAGFEKVKVNTVLVGGFNQDEVEALASLSVQYPVDVRFIELMPMQKQDEFGADAFLPVSYVTQVLPQLQKLPFDGKDVLLYRLPGGQGNVGLISPLSQHFCGKCDRLRLTADGHLKPCLHSSQEISIKGLTFEGMRERFLEAIEAKPACHGVLSATHRSEAGRNMNRIGG